MERRQAALILVAAALLLLFNLFQVVPPLSSSALTVDLAFGESPSRPYIMRVKVERARVVDGVQTSASPVPRMVVRLDDKTGITNSIGYVTFATVPGKHLVTISSPQSILPTYSVDVDIQEPVTELRVLYIEERFRIEEARVSIDSITQTSHVRAFYTLPSNVTYYVGSPYLVYVDFKQYFKVFNGDSLAAFVGSSEIPYQGPFTIVVLNPEETSLATEAVVQDTIQVILIDRSYVPAFRVVNTLLRMS
ncbi:MAG: hypothetical protein RMK31_00745 [Candidatus Caldarchaeum sp.]|nr:hypothetical protein [Candidatus Caldarchaeum sp.]MDW7978567.1 hypothetical protein [Candidatus Caldarchaeum sp.]MDW8359098.1 hypothetical protein [Candidatus Caldarchaeum sp.]